MSVVARALLTSELRLLRTSARLSQEAAASALDWSGSKLLRIEGGTVGVTTTDLRALLQLYGVTDSDRVEELVRLGKEARTRDWWAAYRHINNQEYINYLGYEDGAVLVRQAQCLLIPGLLQTDDYAQSITPNYFPGPDVPQDFIDLRLQRQARVMERANPPQQFYIIDESVIRRGISTRNGNSFMANQLMHLIELSLRPEITIQIVPFEAGHHFGLVGPFTLLSFDNGLGDVLYLESARRGDLTLADPASLETITRYSEGFEALRTTFALSPEASIELISRLAEILIASSDEPGA